MTTATKRVLILSALREIGVAQRDVDVTADEFTEACRRLNRMMMSWDSQGIHVGFASSESTDLDDESGIPSVAEEAVVLGLAIRLAPQYGREVLPATKRLAASALQGLQAFKTTPGPLVLKSGVPLGAGNTRTQGPWRQPFSRGPRDNLVVGDDTDLDFE